MKIVGSGSLDLLVYEVAPGEDLVAETASALRSHGAPFAWVVANGRLREALLEVGAEGRTRAVEGALELASASGTWHGHDGALSLSAVLGRELDRGADVLAGKLAAAVAERAQVVCFLAAPPGASRRSEPAAPSGAGAAEPTPMGGAAAPGLPPAVLPARPPRSQGSEGQAFELEAGDHVTHFAFGDCIVESSDGDRIRLRQEKDERVREVSLSMLRVEPGELHADGRAQYLLLRKN